MDKRLNDYPRIGPIRGISSCTLLRINEPVWSGAFGVRHKFQHPAPQVGKGSSDQVVFGFSGESRSGGLASAKESAHFAPAA